MDVRLSLLINELVVRPLVARGLTIGFWCGRRLTDIVIDRSIHRRPYSSLPSLLPMDFTVGLQNRRTSETFAANLAVERSLPGVNAMMVFEVMAELERFAAVLTAEGPLALVRTHMIHQLPDRVEHADTVLTRYLASVRILQRGLVIGLSAEEQRNVAVRSGSSC